MAERRVTLSDDAARTQAVTVHDRSLLVEAGAGSGKTAIMAGRIAMLLASGIAPAFLLAFVVFFGSAWGAVSILRPLLARDILGEEDFGAKFGALALPFLAGAALAPFLGSLIWEAGGYDTLLIVLIGVTGVGLGLYLAANRAARTGRDRGRQA